MKSGVGVWLLLLVGMICGESWTVAKGPGRNSPEQFKDVSLVSTQVNLKVLELERKLQTSILLPSQLRTKGIVKPRSIRGLAMWKCSECEDSNPSNPFLSCIAPSITQTLTTLFSPSIRPTEEMAFPSPLEIASAEGVNASDILFIDSVSYSADSIDLDELPMPDLSVEQPIEPSALDYSSPSDVPALEVVPALEIEAVEETKIAVEHSIIVSEELLPEISVPLAEEREATVEVEADLDPNIASTLLTPMDHVPPSVEIEAEPDLETEPTVLVQADHVPPSAAKETTHGSVDSCPSSQSPSLVDPLAPLASLAEPVDGWTTLVAAFAVGVACTSISYWLLSTLYSYWKGYPQRLIRHVHSTAHALSAPAQASLLQQELSFYLPQLTTLLGADHLDTCACKHYLARALIHTNDLARAKRLLEEVQAVYEPFGEDRHLALVLEDLGVALHRDGNHDEALDALKRGLNIFVEEFEAEHLDILDEEDTPQPPLASQSMSLYPDHEVSPQRTSPAFLISPLTDPSLVTQTIDYLGNVSTFQESSPSRSRTPVQVLDDLFDAQGDLSTALHSLHAYLDQEDDRYWRMKRQTPLHRKQPASVVDKDIGRVCKEIADVYLSMKAFSEACIYLDRAIYIFQHLDLMPADQTSHDLRRLEQMLKMAKEMAASPLAVSDLAELDLDIGANGGNDLVEKGPRKALQFPEVA